MRDTSNSTLRLVMSLNEADSLYKFISDKPMCQEELLEVMALAEKLERNLAKHKGIISWTKRKEQLIQEIRAKPLRSDVQPDSQ